MREVEQNLATAIQEAGARIRHAALPEVSSDHVRMVQLFQNLVGNAIKFRGPQPPVISISAHSTERQWEFTISDNGIGIAPQHQEAIFAIFQRLHTRTEYPGNGVGLAVCKKIGEQHGGRIWVESDIGKGASFRFTLPAVSADNLKKQGMAVHAADSSGG